MANNVTTIDVNVTQLAQEKADFVYRILAQEVIRLSDDYLPFDSGVLKNSVYVEDGGKRIVYNTPYARYQWYGKLMVDPVYKKGAFFSEDYGFWSRKGVKKELSDRDLEYHNNDTGLRGAYWTTRMWADYGNDICRNIEKWGKGVSK